MIHLDSSFFTYLFFQFLLKTEIKSRYNSHTIKFTPVTFYLYIPSNGCKGLPRWLSGKEPLWKAGDTGSFAGLGRAPGEGNDNPLHYSHLGNHMGRGA